MPDTPTPQTATERGPTTRAIEVTLDPSPSQERWLRSYVGSMRVAYNWALEQVASNLKVRRAERERGVPDDELTPALGWSRESLISTWRAVRDEVHPWHRDVSIHAFRTGLDNAAGALKNFSESRSGKRRGRRVGFPRFKNRHSRQAVTFVELADGVDHRHWINADTRSHVRLMLPRRADDGSWERRHTRPRSEQADGRDRRSELAWVHTLQPDTVHEVWRWCATGRARIQALTIKYEGGRWKAVFRLRLLDGTRRLRNPGEPVARHGGAVGVDLGLKHLVTLDRPVPGLTDEHGHVPNPRVLERHLARLRRLDRAIARCDKAPTTGPSCCVGVPGCTARSPPPADSCCTSCPGGSPAGSTLSVSRISTSPGWPAAKGFATDGPSLKRRWVSWSASSTTRPPTGPHIWCVSAGSTPVRRSAHSAGREPSSHCGRGSTTAGTAAWSSTGT